MNSLLRQKIEEWIAIQLEHVSVYDPVTIHIDQLLGRTVETSETVSVSTQAFTILVEQMQATQTPAQPVLRIPLVSMSKRIGSAVPNSRKTVESQLSIEPPSLYLLDWDMRKHLLICEQYKAPLPFELVDRPIPGIYAYFAETRGKTGIKNDWKFVRNVYAEYYPDYYRRD